MQPFDARDHSSEPDAVYPDSPLNSEAHPLLDEEITQPAASPASARRPSPVGKLLSLLFILLCGGVIGSLLFGNAMLNSSSSLGQGRESAGLFEGLSQIGSFFNPSARDPLLGESQGKTNFLVLGRDNTSEGLTDTIILVSYHYDSDTITTLNIPRDFYVFDGFQSSKINALYANAERRNPGSGEQFLANFLEQELDEDSHYWASAEFESVEQIIDALGGVEVNVENAFTDFQYPDKQYGYLTPAPSFEAGRQRMDGETALIYARSRNGNNPLEQGDFARSRRQSIVLEAMLTKIKDNGVLGNARRIREFYQIIEEYMRTNLRLNEIVSFGSLLKQASADGELAFTRGILADDGVILCPQNNPGTGYILIYCDGSTAGRAQASRSRTALRQKFATLDQAAEAERISEATLAIVGNESFDIDTVYADLVDTLGLIPDYYNRSFAEITPATATSTETTTIYIEDDELRADFEELLASQDLDYRVQGAISARKPLPSGFGSADIIVYVESL